MITLRPLSDVVLLVFLVMKATATYTNDDDLKIVGGTSAEDGQFPYQVSLRSKNRHFCGGSILNERWILTAAHCLAGFNNDSITVVVGTNTLDTGGDSYRSLRLVGHPSYSDLLIRDDIGLIEVEKPIVFGDNVKSVALPTEDFNNTDGSAVLSGWGTTSYIDCARLKCCETHFRFVISDAKNHMYPGKTPNELQHITLSVIDQTECMNTSFRVTKSNICTLNKIGEGACHGDSGGPLVSENVQIGVVSWGTPCARGRPDVFTRVYSYVDWIANHINV